MTAELALDDRLVEVIVEDDRWAERDLSDLTEQVAASVLRELGHAPSDFEVSLLACDDARISALNAEFRGVKKPTNVLAWPSGNLEARDAGEERVFLGDIAMAFETCAAEAEAAQLALVDHTAHLFAHGMLHLLGFDHQETEDAEEMERFEIKVLATLGVKNPYS
ncbi:MAG: rRNA maturation RNase YbeY [Pseudomonadota bacterium]